jgi:hypothetical protein
MLFTIVIGGILHVCFQGQIMTKEEYLELDLV